MRLYFSVPYCSFPIWTSSGSCLSCRFWAVHDPDEMDEEASSLEKHQSRSLHHVVNCEKKASYKNLISISSISSVTHFNNIYATAGRHWRGGRHLFSSLANTWCDQVTSHILLQTQKKNSHILLLYFEDIFRAQNHFSIEIYIYELIALCVIVWLKLFHM